MFYLVKMLKCTKCGYLFDPKFKYRLNESLLINFEWCLECGNKDNFIPIRKIMFGKKCPTCNHIIPTRHLPLGISLLKCQMCGAKMNFDKIFSLIETKEAIVILLIVSIFIIINIILYYTTGWLILLIRF
jgi:predicted Zn-ribbon and HTH transcriptional regulator